MDIVSEAQTAKELRSEIVDYFKIRLLMCQQAKLKGKAKQENDTLAREFRYQITFWLKLKFADEEIF